MKQRCLPNRNRAGRADPAGQVHGAVREIVLREGPVVGQAIVLLASAAVPADSVLRQSHSRLNKSP